MELSLAAKLLPALVADGSAAGMTEAYGTVWPGAAPGIVAARVGARYVEICLAFTMSDEADRARRNRAERRGIVDKGSGRVAEWFKAAVLKTAVGASPP
jgi:hypothetical protein